MMLVITPRAETVEGQPILRPLPNARCRHVGPFVFFDHMLETDYLAGHGMNILQHPHIGLSTLTFLFEGELQHKDSLGSDQRVGPGDVSFMTAGKGIAHVERTPAQLIEHGSRLHGLQMWLASPRDQEQGESRYSWHAAKDLPVATLHGTRIRMIAGNGFGLASPVPVQSPTLYAQLHMDAASSLIIPAEHAERALYVIEGQLSVDGVGITPRSLVVLQDQAAIALSANTACHAVIIGGAPLDGERRMNWNFVASEMALIENARSRWAAGQWPTVPGEIGRIELPK